MPPITPDTFDPLRRYVSVRLQQAVPIVDADWNEKDDIQRFELRSFVKWFIGDGIPVGLDSFRIEGTNAVNDFTILAGTPTAALTPTNGLSRIQRWENGLNRVGRCLIDGLDVIIVNDLVFTAQPLHQSQSGSADLATQWSVPVITMPAPADGVVLAYLDVWERLVRPMEDPSLVHPGLGVESAVRMRCEWVVRVRAGADLPAEGDADFIAGHSYYALATLTRRASSGAVRASDVNDLRQTGLTLKEHIRIPLFVRQGVRFIDPPRFQLALQNFRTSLFNRLRDGSLPYATASATDENIFLLALQQLFAYAQNGELQTMTRNVDNAGALAYLRSLYDEQVRLLDLMNNIANVGNAASGFISTYRSYLDGSPADDISGLRPALDNNRLFDAVIAQEEINQFISLVSDNLPEGSVNAFYRRVIPFEPLDSTQNYTFEFEIESQLSSPLGSEEITLQIDLSAATWELISLTPPALELANGGGTGLVEAVVRPAATPATCTLILIASAARNPLISSTQPGLELAIGAEPPAGSVFLFYGDNPLNPDNQLEISSSQLSDPFGHDIGVRLVNDGPDRVTYQLIHQIEPDDGDTAPWTPTSDAPEENSVQLNADTASTRLINIACDTPEVGETAVLTITATIIQIGDTNVPDGASNTVQVTILVVE